MKINMAILIGIVLVVMAFSSSAMAGDPLEEDEEFLNSDPDEDFLRNWEEFLVGTDPFNPDSDNDGLPDYWELEYSQWRNQNKNAQLDPTNSADAHLDFDYLGRPEGIGFMRGESEAEFNAIRTLYGGKKVTWPADPTVDFITPVFDEEGPHYDNYEEYYRPYTDLVDHNVIRYMHTSPIYSDTDGDGILDPDDSEPLGTNDGTHPGGIDIIETSGTSDVFETESDLQINGIEIKDIKPIVPDNVNIDIAQADIVTESFKNKVEKNLPDIENDGI
jgi:hypothetical protein